MSIKTTQLNWLLSEIDENLSDKGNIAKAVSFAKNNSKSVVKYIEEIQTSIHQLNDLDKTQLQTPITLEILHNTKHLQYIFKEKLPNYKDVVDILSKEDSLRERVFEELHDSNYFKDVYYIDYPAHLLINLLVLIYRTSLLFMRPSLRAGGAQVSSTIEEMACVMHLSGNTTELFKATRHWIVDWEEEGFSKDLADLIQP